MNNVLISLRNPFILVWVFLLLLLLLNFFFEGDFNFDWLLCLSYSCNALNNRNVCISLLLHDFEYSFYLDILTPFFLQMLLSLRQHSKGQISERDIENSRGSSKANGMKLSFHFVLFKVRSSLLAVLYSHHFADKCVESNLALKQHKNLLHRFSINMACHHAPYSTEDDHDLMVHDKNH